jgi:tetratricopeptide (TPR) repeat protein
MQRRFQAASLVLLAGLSLSLVGCNQLNKLQARKSFKEANTLYTQQDYKRASDRYKEAVDLDPQLTQAFFYLANSYDNLYKPSRRGEAQNDAYLTQAVDWYKKSAEQEVDPKIKKLALEYLVSAYGPDKLNDPSQAEPLILQMIQLDPSEPANYFALSKMYEDNGIYDQAESTLLKSKEMRPDDANVYLQLAGFYNRQGEFEKTIEALTERAAKDPNNPEAYYTISTYYWDKAYRDMTIKEPAKLELISKGMEAVDKAISLKPDYREALVYKNLLLRSQALLETDSNKQQALIKQADALRDKAEEMRKQKAAGVGN